MSQNARLDPTTAAPLPVPRSLSSRNGDQPLLFETLPPVFR